jgi:peptide/nickel transport system permease protein
MNDGMNAQKNQATPEQDLLFTEHRDTFRDFARRFYKNKLAVLGLGIIAILLLCAIFPQLITSYSYSEQNLTQRLLPPSSEHLFGTDDYGRDLFTRVIYGSRTSLMVSLTSVSISCLIGIFMGCVAGYYGGVLDNILMRGIDILQAIPRIMLGISIVAAFGANTRNLVLAIGIGAIPGYARIIRASVLSIKEQEFVEAARQIGANDLRVIMRHIVPNCMAPIIVQATMSIAEAILAAAGLSFIGLGVSPPTPEWGAMLSAGRNFMRDHGHVVLFPGLAIMMTVFAFNLFGDGLRDALDPKLKT